MKNKEIKVGMEAIADNRWVIVQEIDGNDVHCMDEDGGEFEIDTDLVKPIDFSLNITYVRIWSIAK